MFFEDENKTTKKKHVEDGKFEMNTTLIVDVRTGLNRIQVFFPCL